MTEDPGREPLLEVDDLETHYPITEGLLRREVGRVRAVDGISFDLAKGEALGLVGESGSGKTTVALSILRLVEPTGGEIVFDGERVTELEGSAVRSFRRRAQLIVQDPNEAFSPRMTIGDAVEEPLLLHGMRDGDRRRAIAEDILERVGLSPDDADRFPHEFSGGEKQRIAIARALVLNPDLIIADEPTSALDGRVQADVLGLLDEVRREFDIAVLFISHDIDVVRRFCDDIAVMYLGEIVEKGPVDEVIAAPAHPYTRVLFGSVPSLDPRDRTLVRPLTDTIPDPADPPAGCRFHTRCPEVIPPEDVDLDREVWQAIARFRFTLEARELPEEVDVEVADAVVDRTRVRDTFGLPEEVADGAIERAVETAVGSIVDGDIDGAIEAVSAAITTPCETATPETIHRDGTEVACHRYDETSAAGPLPWPSSSRQIDAAETD
ncbi:MAG: ABC transporter ATP-binding protein [Halobacteriales archaeon]